MMKKPMMIATAAVALVLAGCAGTPPPNPDPLNLKELLVFSGFTEKLAVSQEDLDQIAGIPQRELLRVASGSRPLYIWVDAAGCRCYYVGGEEAYRRLKELGRDRGVN
jgi:hypothetical protein